MYVAEGRVDKGTEHGWSWVVKVLDCTLVVSSSSIHSITLFTLSQNDSRLDSLARFENGKCFCFLSFGIGSYDQLELKCGPGSIPVRYHARVEFIIGSRLARREFLQIGLFSSLHKHQHLQFNVDG